MQPSEAFFTYLKVSVFVGFLLALPVVFFHVWRFFLPALTVRERMVLGLIVPASVVLFFIGLAFSFFLVLPTAVKFFMGFGGSELEAMFSVGNYFDFVLTFVLPFGFVFELPLIITILGKMGLVSSAFLGRHFRIVIFLSFVIGAIITPTPDIFTQSMIALPMFLLYGVGYVIVRYVLQK
jgi:sec-independent protein translocase protein TatC